MNKKYVKGKLKCKGGVDGVGGGGGGVRGEGPKSRNITIWIKKFTGNKLHGETNLAHALAQSGTPLLSTDFAFIAP